MEQKGGCGTPGAYFESRAARLSIMCSFSDDAGITIGQRWAITALWVSSMSGCVIFLRFQDIWVSCVLLGRQVGQAQRHPLLRPALHHARRRMPQGLCVQVGFSKGSSH